MNMKKLISLLILSLGIACQGWAAVPTFEMPTVKYYTSADESRSDNEMAAKVANYYFTTTLPEDALYAKTALGFLMSWVESSDEILVGLSDRSIGSFFSCNKDIAMILMCTYVCGCVKYNREVKTSHEYTFDMHYYAMVETLRYYERNKSFFGKCKKVERMLKSLNKDRLKKELERNFAAPEKKQ